MRSKTLPHAEEVSFAFNGFKYKEPVKFGETMTVTISNWEGANYVNTKIHFANGDELWLWDSIDYVAPVEVQACAECIAFELLVKDGRNEGFRDSESGDELVEAFAHALEIWSGLLKKSYDGETITIEGRMDDLDDNTVAQAGSNDHSLVAGFVHGDALANHKEQMDLQATAEITATFNTDYTWYSGTDGNPGVGQKDFVSTALHEVSHGLNFFDTILYGAEAEDGTPIPDGTWNYSANGVKTPGIYDSFLVDAQGNHLIDMTNAQRATAITSSNLFWDGPLGKAINNGQRPELYAPAIFLQGFSVSHLDEFTHGDELMSPDGNGADHAPSALELGILEDMGWKLV